MANKISKTYTENKTHPKFGGYILSDFDYPKCKVTFENTNYSYLCFIQQARNGQVFDKNYPSVFDVGFCGEGEFKPSVDKKAYRTWYTMLDRCYNPENLLT